jgi:hypothetical protein
MGSKLDIRLCGNCCKPLALHRKPPEYETWACPPEVANGVDGAPARGDRETR